MRSRWLGSCATALLCGCFNPYSPSADAEATGSDTGECAVGTLDCPCTVGGVCEGGLECVSGVCVPSSGDGDPGDGEPGDGDGDSGDGDGDPGDGDGDPGIPPGEACSTFAQDCVDGYKCQPDYMDLDSGTCEAIVDDPDGLYEPCEVGPDTCDEGLVCFGPTCVELCSGSIQDPICTPDTTCTLSNISMCARQCDPVLANCLYQGESCYPFETGDGLQHFGCFYTSGQLLEGEMCSYINDCSAPNFCEPNTTVCTSYCDIDSLQPCGMACTPFDLMLPNYVGPVGYCAGP